MYLADLAKTEVHIKLNSLLSLVIIPKCLFELTNLLKSRLDEPWLYSLQPIVGSGPYVVEKIDAGLAINETRIIGQKICLLIK